MRQMRDFKRELKRDLTKELKKEHKRKLKREFKRDLNKELSLCLYTRRSRLHLSYSLLRVKPKRNLKEA